MTNRVKSSESMSPRGPAFKENPFACFEAFACLRPITKTDGKGNIISTAEVTWSFPYRERRMIERFGSIDKMAFPTFDSEKGCGVATLSGDGTFIFALTMEGKARGIPDNGRGGYAAYGASPSNNGGTATPTCSVGGEERGFENATASSSASNRPQSQQQNDQQQQYCSSSGSSDDEGASGITAAQQPPAATGRYVSTKERRRRRKEQEKEFKQLYGHCITTVNGEVFMFLSSHMWIGFFRSLLLYYRGNGPDAGRSLLKALYAVPTPTDAGGSFGIRFGDSVLRRPMDYPHLRGIDADPLLLLQVFTDAQLCEIVSALLLVETVIVCGPDFGVVSKVIVALRALIAPVDSNCWVYAPVLPRAMVGHLASPVPGLFGIIDDFLEDATEACETLSSAVFVKLRSTRPPAVIFSSRSRRPSQGDLTENADPLSLDHTAASVGSGFSSEPGDLIYRSPALASSVVATPSDSGASGSKINFTSLRAGRYQVSADNPPHDGSIMCDSVTFLNTHHSPMPRTVGVFRSTLRRGLAAMRSKASALRSSEDFLMLFTRYYAVHLGHVGSPIFTPAAALQRHRASHKGRGDCAEEIEFYERFYESQTCVQLTEDLKAKVRASNQWTTDVFGNMVVQLNPHWFDTELSKYRREELMPVKDKTPWELVVGGGESAPNGGSATPDGRGGLAKALSFLAWCCSHEDVHGSDSEQGPSRTATATNTSQATTTTTSSSSRSQGGGLYLTPEATAIASCKAVPSSGFRDEFTAFSTSSVSASVASSTRKEGEPAGIMMARESDDRVGCTAVQFEDELATYTRKARRLNSQTSESVREMDTLKK